MLSPRPIMRPDERIALDLDKDMAKFKTWKSFNREFEKRLTRKERKNQFNLKRQKGEDASPRGLWRD